MSLVLRNARPEDAPELGRITHASFTSKAEQHGFPTDFPDAAMPTGLLGGLTGRQDVHVLVAEQDGKVAGSCVLWENNPIAGVGPISVDPGVQGSAVGRRLMEHVLERAGSRGFQGVRLVQTPYNCLSMALYSKLGFEVTEPLTVFNGAPLGISMQGHEVRAATPEDAGACAALCMRIHGHDRPGDLADSIAGGMATVVVRDGRITGYATMIGYFGHAVAETNDDMKALIAAAPVIVGPGFHVPSRNGELMRWCLDKGMRIIQPMTLMKIGPYQEPRGAFLPSIIY